ncbi:MAG: RNA methyltransferase [Bacteroidota bacterium]
MKKLANEELNRISVDEFKKTEKSKLVVVLDNIRSLHNIGSVFRTSDAFLVESIYLCGITATPPNKEIHKTALGATESVDWKYFKTTGEAIDALRKNNFKIYAIEQAENSVSLLDMTFDSNQPTAVIFGNEVYGVEQQVVDNCDACIEVPQLGTKHSFNISVTAGMVLWDYFSKTRV